MSMKDVYTPKELADEIGTMKIKYPHWTTSQRTVKGQVIGFITFHDLELGRKVGTYQLLLGELKDKTISS